MLTNSNFHLMKDFSKAKELYARRENALSKERAQNQVRKATDESSKASDEKATGINGQNSKSKPKASEQATAEQQQRKLETAEEDDTPKHPLQNEYGLWLYKYDRNKTWDQNQILINAFKTVEDFWSLFNHIRTPSEIGHGNDYSLFKKNIRPMWEDPANNEGGRWILALPKEEVDDAWLEVVLAMIGEAFEYGDDICGVVINLRKSNKLSIWTTNANNREAILEIGGKLKEVLHLDDSTVIHYHSHSESMSSSSNYVKPLYTL